MASAGPSYEQFFARKDVQNAMTFPDLRTNPMKREKSPPESPEPQLAQYDGPVKLETDYVVQKIEHHDGDESSSGGDEPNAAPGPLSTPLAAPIPAQANVTREPPDIEDTSGMVTVLSEKMNKICDLNERERACRAEMQRISMEVGALEQGALEHFQTGNTRWLLSRISSLSGQKVVMQMILTKVEQRNARRLAKLRKRERERQRQLKQEKEQKSKLEAKRQSNKQQLRSRSALKMPVPHLDLTVAPQPNTEKVFIKTEPDIKMEPMIKIEED
ncbi:hypothetical protein EKO04_001759 [Ascochyta lentis]|uniref:Uncharacterized protein n=1 Tax=Ascochyta lentis TaxID=205686 RepID=A0A8H7J8I8_9PLEO|nr:hypothetical protein EKO04_001759 [Ascochyta lentis]